MSRVQRTLEPDDLTARGALQRFAPTYLRLQAIAVVVWWLSLAGLPALRPWFLPATAPEVFLWAFLPGDLAIVAWGSAIAAHRWADASTPSAFWVAAGGLWFGTAYVVTLAVVGALPWASPVLMVGASVGTGLVSRR